MYTPADFIELSQNFQRINSLLQRLFIAYGRREYRSPGLEGPGAPFYMRVLLGQASGMMSNPFQAINMQMQMLSSSTAFASDLYQALLAGSFTTSNASADRHTDVDWSKHPIFIALQHQHRYFSNWIDASIAGAVHNDERTEEQTKFFAGQLKALISPDNFLATNPEALEKMVETKGRSVADGLQNLVEDIERADGDVLVALADPEGFTVGEDLATTPGHVVFECDLFQLIRYEATTDKVYSRPLLMIPPWINKYYILDLQQKNSMIRWLVGQGFTVYVVSWCNPTAEMSDIGVDDYVLDGVVKAVDTVCELADEPTINVVGYCVGGTATAMAAAWLAKQERPSPIRSLTFFTTLVDFEDPGVVKVFLDESFLGSLLHHIGRQGVMDKKLLARTFSFMRPSDLVYGPAIHSYLLGEKRPKFDLLFWNGDSTSLPARMAREYLIRLFRDNELVEDKFDIAGTPISLKDISTAHYVVAAEKDHIVPWRASFQGLSRLRGQGRFVLAQSGHIAGIINHPDKHKYGYWTNEDRPKDLDAWRAGTEAFDGSWWEDWTGWLGRRSGKKVLTNGGWPENHEQIEPAPGRYVKA